MPIAIVMSQPGGPDQLKPVEIATPEPGPGEIRLRQSFAGVNFVDIYYRSGLYPAQSLPAVLGVEGAGTVEAIGQGVATLSVGDRVAYVGAPLGAYAEVRLLPEGRAVKLPDSISDRVAASSMARGLTAQMLLRRVHATKPGDWILVHAGAGGLGQFLTRWAKRLGARVIATVGSERKIAQAKAAGADEVLLHADASWTDEVRRLADGKGVHFAVDGIGGEILARTLSVVRPFGMVASVGQAAGPIPPVPVEDLGPRRSIALMRPSVMGYSSDPELYRSGADELLAVLQDGLTSPIGAEYPLRDAAKAHAALEAGETTGSVVLAV
jgi:NADPH2:quinone reductase